MYIDPDGNKIIGVTYNPKTGQYSYTKAALKNGTKRYIDARIQTGVGREAIHKLHSDEREVRIVVTDRMLVTYDKDDDSYTVSGGSTEGFEEAEHNGNVASIYISLNDYGTNDASTGKAGTKIKAAVIDDEGNLSDDLDLIPSDFSNLQGKGSRRHKIHMQENKRAGVDEFYNKWNPNKEQSIYSIGEHEETHLNEKRKIDYRKGERSAYTNEAAAQKEYLKPRRFTGKPAKKL